MILELLTDEQQVIVRRAAALNITPESEDWRWVHKYPAQCLIGEIESCRAIKLAALRHFKDVCRDDVYLSMDEIDNVYQFKAHCVIPRGDLVGQPMKWTPPHIWLILSKLCWKWAEDKYEDLGGQVVQVRWKGKRRFRESFQQVARKFAKTSVLGAFPAAYILYTSPPRSAGYSFATKLSQASIVWGDIAGMIDYSPFLGSIWTHNTDKKAPIIRDPETKSEFTPLASGSGTKDGLDPSVCVLDEAHGIKDAKEYGVMTSAMGMQKQPLLDIVTTAGNVLDGVCVKKRREGLRVLDPFDDFDIDTIFYAIFELDEGDDWTDETNWFKANPAVIYGMPLISQLRQEFLKAQDNYEDKVEFLTKHCNLYVNSASKWLSIDEVRACADAELRLEDFVGRKGVIGFDRSVNNDVTSLCFLFPDDDGGVTCFWRNMQVEAAVKEANEYLRAIYRNAADKGHLDIITNSAIIRTEHLTDMIWTSYHDMTTCEHIAYDPYKMKEVGMQLEEKGLPVVAVGQGPANISEPAKKLEGLIKDRRFRYNGDTMFEYACQCAVADTTKYGNLAVRKEDDRNEKIDPLISCIIALSSATLHTSDNISVLSDRGMLWLE